MPQSFGYLVDNTAIEGWLSAYSTAPMHASPLGLNVWCILINYTVDGSVTNGAEGGSGTHDALFILSVNGVR
jgi:hypothetical protein